MKDPAEPFRFSFPDMQGQIVSNTDARFRGKVVLVNISGSWCPNCHDEAPFLSALYKQVPREADSRSSRSRSRKPTSCRPSRA